MDYYTHEFTDRTGRDIAKNFSAPAHDFWDNGRPAKELAGTYATYLYTSRAEEIIALHGNKTEKVPNSLISQLASVGGSEKSILEAALFNIIVNISHP